MGCEDDIWRRWGHLSHDVLVLRWCFGCLRCGTKRTSSETLMVMGRAILCINEASISPALTLGHCVPLVGFSNKYFGCIGMDLRLVYWAAISTTCNTDFLRYWWLMWDGRALQTPKPSTTVTLWMKITLLQFSLVQSLIPPLPNQQYLQMY